MIHQASPIHIKHQKFYDSNHVVSFPTSTMASKGVFMNGGRDSIWVKLWLDNTWCIVVEVWLGPFHKYQVMYSKDPAATTVCCSSWEYEENMIKQQNRNRWICGGYFSWFSVVSSGFKSSEDAQGSRKGFDRWGAGHQACYSLSVDCWAK